MEKIGNCHDDCAKFKYGISKREEDESGNKFGGDIFENSFFHHIVSSPMDSNPFNGIEQSSGVLFERDYHAKDSKQSIENLGANKRIEIGSNSFGSYGEEIRDERTVDRVHDFFESNKIKFRGKPRKYLKEGSQKFELGLDILGKDRSLRTSSAHLEIGGGNGHIPE